MAVMVASYQILLKSRQNRNKNLRQQLRQQLRRQLGMILVTFGGARVPSGCPVGF